MPSWEVVPGDGVGPFRMGQSVNAVVGLIQQLSVNAEFVYYEHASEEAQRDEILEANPTSRRDEAGVPADADHELERMCSRSPTAKEQPRATSSTVSVSPPPASSPSLNSNNCKVGGSRSSTFSRPQDPRRPPFSKKAFYEPDLWIRLNELGMQLCFDGYTQLLASIIVWLVPLPRALLADVGAGVVDGNRGHLMQGEDSTPKQEPPGDVCDAMTRENALDAGAHEEQVEDTGEWMQQRMTRKKKNRKERMMEKERQLMKKQKQLMELQRSTLKSGGRNDGGDASSTQSAAAGANGNNFGEESIEIGVARLQSALQRIELRYQGRTFYNSQSEEGALPLRKSDLDGCFGTGSARMKGKISTTGHEDDEHLRDPPLHGVLNSEAEQLIRYPCGLEAHVNEREEATRLWINGTATDGEEAERNKQKLQQSNVLLVKLGHGIQLHRRVPGPAANRSPQTPVRPSDGLTHTVVRFRASAQDVLTDLGCPDDVEEYDNVSQRDYGYCYFRFGLSLYFDARTHQLAKIFLFTNVPGHPKFGRYDRCFFQVPLEEKLVVPSGSSPSGIISSRVSSSGQSDRRKSSHVNIIDPRWPVEDVLKALHDAGVKERKNSGSALGGGRAGAGKSEVFSYYLHFERVAFEVMTDTGQIASVVLSPG